MKKLKIAVYAIAKNEEKFVNRWVKSMQEADDIYVLDTGSTDKTVKLLKENNVHVKIKKITPWRFDVARNASLEMVPKDIDICVCTDLDEILEEGWRKELETSFKENKNATRARYNYNWKLDENNHPLVSFRYEKIHIRNGYKWTHPVHEVLEYSGPCEKYVETNITLNHYPDNTKSRSMYLPLLELSVKENPLDDRNLHYLGREYMYYHYYDKCIKTLHKHLKCPNATWKDERCASMRFIARSYWALNYLEEAIMWYQKAIEEAPYLREGYIELANLYLNQNNYLLSYKLAKKALKIKEKSPSYINEEFAWNSEFYDLLVLSSFYTGHVKESLRYAKKALELNPKNIRYQENYQIIKNLLESSSHE